MDIIDAVERHDSVGFCVYGGVVYSKNRKKKVFRSFPTISVYLDEETIELALEIKQLFKKYSDWSYEKEFRYVVSIKDSLDQPEGDIAESGLVLNVTPKDYYFGNKFDFNVKTKTYLNRFIGPTCSRFALSKRSYQLIEEKVDLTR